MPKMPKTRKKSGYKKKSKHQKGGSGGSGDWGGITNYGFEQPSDWAEEGRRQEGHRLNIESLMDITGNGNALAAHQAILDNNHNYTVDSVHALIYKLIIEKLDSIVIRLESIESRLESIESPQRAPASPPPPPPSGS